MDNRLKQLRWRCRRGMRELDTLLLHYLEQHYLTADKPEQSAFEKILEMQDPELWLLVTGKSVSDDKGIQNIVNRLQHTHRT